MIKPILKDILRIQDEDPEDITDFNMLLQACISIDDSEGSELFDFYITTPKGIINFIDLDDVLPIRGVFIVNELDMKSNIEVVKYKINKVLECCKRETWEEVALAINYYMDWEYYDPSCGICDFYLTTRGLK